MQKKRLLAGVVSLGLVAVVGVGGTLAYLSAKSDVVENTFSVGKGFIPGPDGENAIVLDEVKVDPETGVPVANGERVLSNNYDNLLPADVRTKDPTVHLTGGSVDSYIFVNVEGLDDLEKQHVTVTDFNIKDWARVFDGTSGKYDGVYMYVGTEYSDGTGVVDVKDEAEGEYVSLPAIFEHIQMDSEISQDELAKLPEELEKLELEAVAVQADNITPEEALQEAKSVAKWN